jgi:hypothetical protein
MMVKSLRNGVKQLAGNIEKDKEGKIMLLFVVGWTIVLALTKYLYCSYYWLIDGWMDRQTVVHTIINGQNDGKMDSQINKDRWTDQQMERWTDWQTERWKEGQTDRQMDRRKEDQAGRQTDRQIGLY